MTKYEFERPLLTSIQVTVASAEMIKSLRRRGQHIEPSYSVVERILKECDLVVYEKFNKAVKIESRQKQKKVEPPQVPVIINVNDNKDIPSSPTQTFHKSQMVEKIMGDPPRMYYKEAKAIFDRALSASQVIQIDDDEYIYAEECVTK